MALRDGYMYGNDCFWGNLYLEYKYRRSYHSCDIAESIFPRSTLVFTGSQVANRQPTALIADYFGMSQSADVRVAFSPLIQYHRFNIGLTLGLNNICDGIWLQFNLPVVHTKWELRHDCDNTCNSGCPSACSTGTLPTDNFPAGYMDLLATPAAPLTTVEAALQGRAFGAMKTDWNFGAFCGCDQEDTELAFVDVKLGYNFYECPDYHIGAYLKVNAPTGTRLDCTHAKCIFNPIIGDDHWKLGAGLTAHAEIYNCDDAHTVTAYFEGYVVHPFERNQARSFDLNNGVMSRYMLLKFFKKNSTTGLQYNPDLGLVNAIDYTTRKVKVGIDVQGEALLEFVYRNECGLAAGLGYNFYGRSHEKICRLCCPCRGDIDDNPVGIKGCSVVQAQGFTTTGTPEIISGTQPTPQPIAYTVAATQSNATITSCGAVDNAKALHIASTGTQDGFVYVDNLLNKVTITPGTTLVSDVAIAETSATGTLAIDPTTGAVTGLTNAPVLLTVNDLNLSSGEAPSQVVHKIYGHLDYYWTDCDWTPYIRGGLEVEFASRCQRGVLNTWGAFIGGGISF